MLLAAAESGLAGYSALGEGAGVLGLRVVGQAQPQRAEGGAADGVVHAGVELAELGRAVLPEPVGLELGERQRAARRCPTRPEVQLCHL